MTNGPLLNFNGHLQRATEFINKALTRAVAQLKGGITITPDNFIAQGDFAATQGRGNACTKSGGTYNNTYCHALRVANRKVKEVTEHIDSELVTKAFGK